MTASSPCTVGMIETRKSIVRPFSRSLKRPSWGTRFSAMSSSDITLMREMMVEWWRLSIGSIAWYSTPSMRYLTITSRSRVSTWMSEARRWMALKTMVSTSLMIGEVSAVMRSIESASSPFSRSCTSWMRKSSVASSSTRWVDSDFSRISAILLAGATRTSTGAPSASSTSSTGSMSGRVGHRHHDHVALPVQGHELVAQHHVDRDLPEQLGLAAELRQLVERQRRAAATACGRARGLPPRGWRP